MQLYPNDAVFPEPHVCLRLELVAAGRWPEAGPASKDDSRVASAMLKVEKTLLNPKTILQRTSAICRARLKAFKKSSTCQDVDVALVGHSREFCTESGARQSKAVKAILDSNCGLMDGSQIHMYV